MRSVAVLFAKPHISGVEEILNSVVPAALWRLGILPLSSRMVDATRTTLEEHYMPHSFFAFSKARFHCAYLTRSALDTIRSRTGASFTELVENRLILSADEAASSFDLAERDLFLEWEAAGDHPRVQTGYHIKHLTRLASGVWVVNGYFPYRFALLEHHGPPKIKAWLLQYPPGMSVKRARDDLLGEINGSPQTLRGYLSSYASKWGISVDIFNNGFHLSDTEGASLREVAIWFPDLIKAHWLAHEVLLQGLASELVLRSLILSQTYAHHLSALDDPNVLRKALDDLLTQQPGHRQRE